MIELIDKKDHSGAMTNNCRSAVDMGSDLRVQLVNIRGV